MKSIFEQRLPGFKAKLDRYEAARAVRAESRLAMALFFIPLGVWLGAVTLLASCYVAYLPYLLPLAQARRLGTYIRWSCLAVLAVRELVYGRRDCRSLIGLAIVAALVVLIFPHRSSYIFDAIWFVYVARDIPFKRIARFILVEMSVLVAFVVVGVFLGIVYDVTYDVPSRGLRHSLGFSHPNTPAALSFCIACLWTYVRGSKFSWVDVAGVMAFACIVYLVTYSRTALVLTILLLVAMALARILPRRWFTTRFVKLAVIGSILFIAVGAIVLSACYDPNVEWMSLLNKLFSGRLSWGHDALVQLGAPPFGQSTSALKRSSFDRYTLQWRDNTQGLVVDDLYVQLVVFFGWVFLAAVLAICTASMARLYQEGRLRVLAILILFALYGVFETCPSNLMFNPFLLLLAAPMALPASPRSR